MSTLPVRFIRVLDTARITPRTTRITFGGEGLADLTARLDDLGPDQQVKLYFPRPGQRVPHLPAAGDADLTSWYEAWSAIPEAQRPWMRSFTIRAHDPATATIAIDFVLHGVDGPASRWGREATP